MSFARARFIRALLLCGLVGVVLPLPALGSKPVPCWEALINESYTGRITTIYPLHCYAEALKRIPEVATIYGNEKQQIQAAAAAAARHQLPKNQSGPPAASSSTSQSAWSKFIHKFDPGSANAFPTPLLILGALAILLVIAGIAGMLWQRSHPRGADPPAAS
jgi:hypothetical protein